ncbi:MAG: chemotaxis protein CheW [Candidatus Nanopelagicales bacterium]
MTATLFTPRPSDEARRGASAVPAPAAPVDAAPPAEAVAPETVPAAVDPAAGLAVPTGIDGYVVFRVGGTDFAVQVGDVREVLRAARIDLLPDSGREINGRTLALVDARGRSIPVLDLRSRRDAPGDVLIPMWRHNVGVVVDRVVSVRSPRELVRETDDVPAALPTYARGVLRPADGGAPVLLIAMPDAPELEADARRVDEPRLGEDVLGQLPDDDLIIAS